MKKYINILFAAAVSALALVSCVKEQEVKPGTPDAEDCQGVYFPKQDVIEETQIFDPTQEKVAIIKVARGVSEGALTIVPKVSLSEITSAGTVDGDVALFTVSDIVFEDGQTETEIEIEFPEVKEGVQYSLHLAVEGDQYTSKYSSKVNTCDFKMMCVAYQNFLNPVTKEPAKVTFTSAWWEETHTAYIKYYEVDGVRHCVTYDEKLVGIPDVDGGADGFWGKGKDQHFEFLWYTADQAECACGSAPHKCTIPSGHVAPAGSYLLGLDGPQYIFTHASAGNIYMFDHYQTSVVLNGYTNTFLHYTWANDYVDETAYYDNNGGFFFYTDWNMNTSGSGWGINGFDLIGIAEGFTRADYTLELTSGVTEKDAEDNNVVPVSFKLGADADLVGYTILEGQASASAIEKEVAALTKETEEIAKEKDAWLEGEVDFSKFTNTWVFAKGKSFTDYIAPKEGSTGFYTVVAVAVDTAQVRTGEGAERKISEVKLAVKNDANVFFKYINNDEANTVILNVAAGSTEKYASRGFSATSSLEYTISGVGITGAIPLVLSEADVEKEGGIDALVAGMLEDSNAYYAMLSDKEYAKYVLPATALADVNDNGYSDIVTGLSANTTYYVVVWATNGYHCGVEYATLTTDGLPNVVIKEGTATYSYSLFFTDDDGNPVDDNGLNLEYNPNTKMYEIPNWGYGVTLTFSVEDNKISVPLQYVGYTHPSYGQVNITDFSHLDEYIGAGFCDYFGIDPTEKGYINDDGTYCFLVAYAVSAGTFGRGMEYFYPDGKPAAASAPAMFSKKAMSFNGELVDFNGQPIVKNNNHFINITGVSGLEPVVSSYKKVEAKHSYSVDFSKRNGKSEILPATIQPLNCK